MKWDEILTAWRGGLLVSCQVAADSPLARPDIVGGMARIAELNGAAGIVADGASHIRAARNVTRLPMIGVERQYTKGYDVYLTPTYECAARVAFSGANVIALDATERPRPKDETFKNLAERIHSGLKKPVMASVATFGQGMKAVEECGADLVATTLAGYTVETANQKEADFALVELLAQRLEVPIICEGRLRSPEDVRRAFNAGAFAVIIGSAITGIDWLVRRYAAATPRQTVQAMAS